MVQGRKLINLARVVRIAIEHAEGVVSVVGMGGWSELLLLLSMPIHISLMDDLLEAIVSQIVIIICLLQDLVLDQVLNLALRQLGCRMVSVCWLYLLTRAHIEKTLVELLLDLARRQVHVLIMIHELVERLLLGDESFGWLCGRPTA